MSRALAKVQRHLSTIHQEVQPESPVSLPVEPNRTQEKVFHRHATNTAAILTKAIEAQLAIDASAHLARRSLHRQVEGALEANELVRAQQYQADHDDVEAIGEQTKRIHNQIQQRILGSAVSAIGDITERAPIVEEEGTFWERTRERVGRVVTGELPKG
jgi:hypothetical protein